MPPVTLPNPGNLNLPEPGQPNSWSNVLDNDNAIIAQVNGNLDASNLAANAVTTAKITDANVTDAKLTSPNNNVYRSLIFASAYAGLQPVASYAFAPGNGTSSLIASGTSTAGLPPAAIRLTSTDYAVAGKTTKLRLIGHVFVGATAPSTVSLTFGLSLLSITGGNYAVGGTAFSVVSSGLATNNIFVFDTGDQAFPSNGDYLLSLAVGSITVPAGIGVNSRLLLRHV